jgi:hypothetical protein
VADRHTDHDLLLVAAFAAGDLEAGDVVPAQALVANCAECRSLATDLQAIARATADVPAPRRPRDFFLSPADARRLRPNGLRRLAATFARPRIQSARPLAGGLMMLGFAGLLIASLPGVSQQAGLPASDQRLEAHASPPPGSDAQGGQLQPAAASPRPYASGSEFTDVQGGAGQASATPTEPDATAYERDTAAGPSALLVGSVAVLAIGAGLFLASLLRTGPRTS